MNPSFSRLTFTRAPTRALGSPAPALLARPLLRAAQPSPVSFAQLPPPPQQPKPAPQPQPLRRSQPQPLAPPQPPSPPPPLRLVVAVAFAVAPPPPQQEEVELRRDAGRDGQWRGCRCARHGPWHDAGHGPGWHDAGHAAGHVQPDDDAANDGAAHGHAAADGKQPTDAACTPPLRWRLRRHVRAGTSCAVSCLLSLLVCVCAATRACHSSCHSSPACARLSPRRTPPLPRHRR